MKREKWFEDQPVLKDDLERAQGTKEAAITERFLDLLSPGVVRGTQKLGESIALLISQGPTAGLYITVNTGIAYSPAGERIIIDTLSTYNSSAPTTTTDNGIGGTTLTPQTTGSQNIPVTNNTVNYVWLGYLQTTDPSVFTLSETTNERLFVKQDDSYEVIVTTTTINPDSSRFVLLGEVTTSGGLVTDINIANDKEELNYTAPIPLAPYQISLPIFPNLPAGRDQLVDIPSVTGFTYVTSAPTTGQFNANLKTGVLTFAAIDTSLSAAATYEAVHTRRWYCVTLSEKVGGYVSFNTLTPTYEPAQEVTFDEHLNARGSGIVTPTNPHGVAPTDIGLSGVTDIGTRLASPGITTATGDVSTISSALSPSAVSAFAIPDNKVVIAPLVAGESLNISGNILVSTDIASETTFNFIDPSTLLPLAAGTYIFYVDVTTKSVQRTSGSAPDGSFSVASIYWDGAKLHLPITDLRTFGTSAKQNIRLETLLALTAGAATDNRLSTVYNSRIEGTVPVTAPTYAYVGLGSTTLNLSVDGSPVSVVFPALPVDVTLDTAVNYIGAAIPSVKVVKTPLNTIKILAAISVVATGGSAAPILGFDTSTSGNEIPSFVITTSNNKIDFKANAGLELHATLATGTYLMGADNTVPTSLCSQIKKQLQIADPSGTYSVSFNTGTNKVTISRSAGTLQILWATGLNNATSARTVLGFTLADTANAASVTSDSTTAAATYISSIGQTDNEVPSFSVNSSSNKIDFSVNAGPELHATLDNGVYAVGINNNDLNTLCGQIKTKMQAADPSAVYAVAFNNITRKITISRSSGTLQILWATGLNTINAAYEPLGFTAVDTANASSVTSDSTTLPATYVASSADIKEMRIEGSTSSVGVGGGVEDATIVFIYDTNRNLTSIEAKMGNKILTTAFTFNSDGSMRSIQEIVS